MSRRRRGKLSGGRPACAGGCGRAGTYRKGHCRECHGLLPPCAHCGKNRVNRPRGLCWTCYHTHGVKDLYPPTSKYASRGAASDFTGRGTPPAEPTVHPPGSPGKIEVMAGRVARREQLFHPLDAGERAGAA